MNAYLVEAKRTAIGRAHPDKGLFRAVRADEMLAGLMRGLLDGRGDGEALTAAIDDIYIGCVGQHLEQGKNIARLSALLAGLPATVPGVTINRLCASSLQAFNFAASTIAAGNAELLLAGGVEHMGHVPMAAALDYNQQLLERYEFPFTNMGLTAEKVAQVYGVSREQQDDFAVESHRKAVAAQQAGHFAREIIPIPAGDSVARQDQSPRPGTNRASLAGLKTIFKQGGTVTAGNSSPLNDGASLTRLRSAVAAGCAVGVDQGYAYWELVGHHHIESGVGAGVGHLKRVPNCVADDQGRPIYVLRGFGNGQGCVIIQDRAQTACIRQRGVYGAAQLKFIALISFLGNISVDLYCNRQCGCPCRESQGVSRKLGVVVVGQRGGAIRRSVVHFNRLTALQIQADREHRFHYTAVPFHHRHIVDADCRLLVAVIVNGQDGRVVGCA